MNLKDYLYKNKITQVDFAKKLGISLPMLWAILSGSRNPSYEILKKIHMLTKKTVAIDEIVSPDDRRRTRVNKRNSDKTEN